MLSIISYVEIFNYRVLLLRIQTDTLIRHCKLKERRDKPFVDVVALIYILGDSPDLADYRIFRLGYSSSRVLWASDDPKGAFYRRRLWEKFLVEVKRI